MNTIDSLRRAATAQATTPEERAEDERRRFITANAELAHLTVRQGYALRVLRGAALAQTAVQAAFTALRVALDDKPLRDDEGSDD